MTRALEILVGKDQLEGMTCSKTKQQIEAWKQVTLEELPVILILHLKWFDYKLNGCSKIFKKVEFPIDLKVDASKFIMKSRVILFLTTYDRWQIRLMTRVYRLLRFRILVAEYRKKIEFQTETVQIICRYLPRWERNDERALRYRRLSRRLRRLGKIRRQFVTRYFGE